MSSHLKNALLIYHDKRIQFGDKEYTRSQMAVLDRNENVDRDYTSISNYEDARRPRCKSGHKNLIQKQTNSQRSCGTRS